MDVKDLRTETAQSERKNDGSKYIQGGVALQCNRNKSYQDIVSNPLAKAEPAPVRPCAVIGPDRVLPSPTTNDPFLKKGSLEPWPSPDNVYRHPPEYPHKLSSQNPSRNISPRQTFQENMQRIMVPPTYNIARHSSDANFNHVQDRNIVISKNAKPNVAPDAKYCDVPYAINTLTNEPKNIRETEMYVPSVNSPLTRTASHGWPPGSVNVHTPKTYSAHELYQYPQYPSCAGQRPTVIPMNRPHRTFQEDAAYGYPDPYYQDPAGRFKPYPPVKDRYPQPRYEYIGNYASQFHPPPPIQPHKYDISKSGSTHPFPVYPHLKYSDNRVPDHTLEGYQRTTNQQPHYNLQFRNQVIHPTYAPVPANSSQSRIHHYLPDGSVKNVASNKLHFDNSSKMYIDYENARTKTYPMPDNYYVNEMGRVHSAKNQMILPNYSPIGVHSIPSQQHYRKDNTQMKPYEYMPHFRNFEPHLNNSAMLRHGPQFSPNTLAISPTDSNISNDTPQTHGTSQEDYGYVSQSSTASVRSIDSSIYRLPHEYYKRYDSRYGPIVGSSPTHTKSDLNSNNVNSKVNKQKQIDVRQFLQMWNEGEEDFENNNSKEIVIQTGSSESSNLPKQHLSNQDQLYVLGLVNVPSEELSKYEHIQKISKLPENIKGYNNLELLSQFEEAIESSNTSGFKSIPKEYQRPSKDSSTKLIMEALPRPLSPLDVEAKISQSVIHKEVGCNFEIRPCSPKMLNVEVPAPAQNVLCERVIEKVTNPLSKIVKSPIPIKSDENQNCHTIKRQENTFAINDNPSCKMIRSPYATNNIDSVKANYSLQDLEINSGVCLASLPRLDNEIELNFPEVNQQFINANKKDGISTTKNCPQQDLGEIDAEKDDVKVVSESDKTLTKLSKYRKLKTSSTDNSGNDQLTKAVRTDSVIIKNPENIKNIEDKLLENSNNLPINLSSQLSVNHELPDKQSENSDIDIALDFSLNKSGNDLPIIDMEKEEMPKSFANFFPHVSYENVSPTDSSKSSKNTKVENQLLNSNDTVDKCIKTDNSCVKNNKEEKDVQAVFNEKTIKLAVEEQVTDIKNICCDILMSENCEYVHKNINKKIFESLETGKDNKCVDSKKYDTEENVCKYEENKETMQFITEENEIEVGKNEQISSKNDNDFEHDEISASLEKLFQESNEEITVLNTVKSSLDISVSKPPKTPCYQQSKELFSPWIQKLLTHSEGLCSNIESIPKNSITCITDVDEGKTVQISTDIFQSQSMDLDHDNRTRDMFNTTQYKQISVEEKEKLNTEELCLEKSSSEWIDAENCKINSLCNVETTDSDINKQELNTFQESVNEVIKCDPILSTVRIDNRFKTTNSETYVTGETCEILDSKKSNCKNDDMTRADLSASTLENEFVSFNKELLKQKCLIENDNRDSAQVSEMFDRIYTVYDNNNIVQEDFNNRRFEKLPSDVSSNCIEQQKEENQCSESLTKIAVNDSNKNQVKENQGGEKLLGNHVIEECDKNTGETSKTFESDSVVHEDHKHGYENMSNSVANNCPEHQIKENQDPGEKIVTNEIIENHHNASSKLLEKNYGSNITQENAVSESWPNSVRLKYDEHHSKENKDEEQTIESDVIEIHDSNTDIILEKVDSSNITQEDCNNPGIANLCSSVSSNFIEYQTIDNHGREKIIQKHVIESQNNDTCEILDAFDSSNVVQDDYNHSPQSWSISASDNRTEHQKKENLVEASVIIESDVIKNRNNNISKILETVDNNICRFDETVIENHKNNISNGSTDHGKEMDQSSGNLIVNVNNDCEDTGELRSEILNGIVCQDHNIFEEDQNNVSQENSSSVFGKIDYTEHQRQESGKSENFIEDVTNDCNSANASETSDISDIIEADQSTSSPEVLSNSVSDICSEQQSTEDQGEKLTNIGEDSTSKTSEIVGSSDIACKFNQITREDQNDSGPGSLSCSIIENCIRNQTEKNETLEKSEEVKNHKYNITEEKENTKNKIVLFDTDNNTVISSARDTSKNNLEADSFTQENEIKNLPNSFFDKWTKHKKNEKTLVNETKIVSDDMCVQCEINTEKICYEREENYQVKVKNIMSNTDSQENSVQESPVKSRIPLKRSFSDSALHCYKNSDTSNRQIMDNAPLIWPSKRPRMNEHENSEQHVIEENLCSFIQNNRRNSVSSFYNGENVSFCILIDNNCIITDENEEEKICFAEISEECITDLNTANEEENEGEVICTSQENELHFSDSVILDYENEKSVQESWLDNVACVETVVSDDIDENVIASANVSPRDIEVSEYDESEMFNNNISEYTDEINFINDETIPDNVCLIEETSHVDFRTVLYDEEPEGTELCDVLYGKCLQKIHLESNIREGSPSPTLVIQTDHTESVLLPLNSTDSKIPEDKENIFMEKVTLQSCENYADNNSVRRGNDGHCLNENINQSESSSNIALDNTIQSCESSTDNVFSYKNEDDVNVDYTTSSSPEVSSTTFEEKSSSILLKITNYNGSRVSEINELRRNRPRCRFTEENAYSNSNGSFPKKPLITKAAQKYIPPLKESICDLKVKLPLPQQRLLKLKQLKLSITEPKTLKQNNYFSTVPKKPKPNFEDVLKNIDKVQIKMHKEKSKKGKNIVPKVVIKKNLNGSHYTSSLNKDTFNPDLTGRKWQPWVFLEKNRFIDNMAIKNKTKAVFSHRKNTYVLAEKFKKYKSVSNCSAKFVISQPKTGNSSRGQLKYTIKLKHTY